jgi:hypothetical protein
MSPQLHATPDMSPLSQRQKFPVTPTKGLAFSRWNPERPTTPPNRPLDHGFGFEGFAPRDVTNLPWHERTDSFPRSLHSQSDLSSSPSSPVLQTPQQPAGHHHDPAIRDSWYGSTPGTPGRRRTNSTLGDRFVAGDEYDPFKPNSVAPTKVTRSHHQGLILASGGASSPSSSHRDSISNGSPAGGLFQKMRSIFENPQGNASQSASPIPIASRPRPESGVYTGAARRPRVLSISGVGGDGDGYPGRKGGFLNEHEDEIDEQSALLGSSAGGLDAN